MLQLLRWLLLLLLQRTTWNDQWPLFAAAVAAAALVVVVAAAIAGVHLATVHPAEQPAEATLWDDQRGKQLRRPAHRQTT